MIDLERIADEAITPKRREAPASNVAWESDATFECALGTIAYWSSGAGPAVALVHGWEGSHADLDALLALDAEIGPLAGVIAHSAGCAATGYAGLHASRVALVATPERYDRYLRWFAEEAGFDGSALFETFNARGIDVASLVLPENASRIDVPLIVQSFDDRTCDVSGAQRVSAAWRGSELMLVGGLGHTRILRDPGVVERIVEFIDCHAGDSNGT